MAGTALSAPVDDGVAARGPAGPAADMPSDLDTGAPPVTLLWVAPGRCESMVAAEAPAFDALPERGFVWIDAHHESPREWVATAERLTGASILDEHLSDAENAAHPSYFDSTRDYEMIVFRGLAFRPEADAHEPIRIRTRPTVFFLFPRCVVSVRPADSRQVPALRRRLLDAARFKQRLPSRPEELMLRVLNGMVDRYLELRQPMTDQLETWQRELLDPRTPFRDWVSLLEARRQLRKLENLSEEQLDALQEWRDERLDRHGGHAEHGHDWGDSTEEGPVGPAALPALTDALEVRVNDLVEHIERVRNHAHRLETSVESAVQLHFSATAHRTNQIMRTLTVLTAIFMPLTLITGIFGMNFEVMPGTHSPAGFWWTMGAMATIAIGLVSFFRYRRYLESSGLRGGSARGRRRR
ncbi:MAG: magnesium transporter CorA family protein [Burkholderiales bacterium]